MATHSNTQQCIASQIKAVRGIANHRTATHSIRHVLAYVGPPRARNLGNKIRDAMLKLGTLWVVPRQVGGERRPPAEVAHEIEENMLAAATKILIGSVAQPATSSSKYRRVMGISE